MPKKQETKCPWCEQVIPTVTIEAKVIDNDFSHVRERRCSKCGKVLAAYLEEEGEFLSRIRTF